MKKRGMALIVVLMLSFILMILLFSSFTASSNNILFVASYRSKTAAFYAAEAGIYDAINKLQGGVNNNLSFEAKMPNSEASYKVNIDNYLNSPQEYAVITSTGIAGNFKRCLQVTVEKGAGSYNGLYNDGTIEFKDGAFINGIRSLKNPKIETGNIHSNSDAVRAIFGSGDPGKKVYITGKASARGGVDYASMGLPMDKVETGKTSGVKALAIGDIVPPGTIFSSNSIPADGVIMQNTKINGSLVVNGNLELKGNQVLYVKGDMVVNGAIYGEGKIVVEGNTTFRGYSKVSTDSKGIVIYSGGDLSVAHPLAVIGGRSGAAPGAGSGGNFSRAPAPAGGSAQPVVPDNPVATYFATMPQNAPETIQNNLPQDAPRDAGFFDWYRQNMAAGSSASSSFQQWRNGSGEKSSTGLPDDVKEWLDNSLPITDQIKNSMGQK
ncbi:MAG: hypothetical protein M1536_03465 [Firmicutes bacterium]|nr:hypothetical protein [Bacillota bacterium]